MILPVSIQYSAYKDSITLAILQVILSIYLILSHYFRDFFTAFPRAMKERLQNIPSPIQPLLR